jgi:broad specificity phosphatase PhoE
MGTLLLVRHAQASFGLGNYDQLSTVGQHQATLTARALKEQGVRPLRVVTGLHARHRQTASPIVELCGGAGLVQDASSDWNELDAADLIGAIEPHLRHPLALRAAMLASGNPARAFTDHYDRALQTWTSDPAGVTYALTWPVFQKRVMAALQQLADRTPSGAHTVVVTSAGPITAVALALLGAPPSTFVRTHRVMVNAGITRIASGSRGLHLASLNEQGHLLAAGREWLTGR